MRHVLKIGEGTHGVELTRAGTDYRLRVDDGPQHRVRLAPGDAGAHALVIDGRSEPVWLAVDGERVHVHIDGAAYEVGFVDPLRHYAGDGGSSADDVALAPMPGTVIAVHVAAGDVVEPGQALVVIESMKLETTIKAWRAGTVEAVHVAKGEAFERQAALVTLAGAAGGA